MEFDIFIVPKILHSLHQQPDSKLAGVIYLGCKIGKLSFWDQFIGNSLINLGEDELRPQDMSSRWYAKNTILLHHN